METAPMIYNPAQFERRYVETARDLDDAVRELAAADAIGVDLEMAQRVHRQPGGVQTWVHTLALIQIASRDLSVVVDPLRLRDLSPLRPLFGGPVRKVFLGGGQDDTLLTKEGIPARTIVDVGEVALGIFGRREDGMAALADRIFGVSLDKSVRRANWASRPLNPALITYAHQDAELTLLIYFWLKERYPEAIREHQRPELDPRLPPSTSAWLQEAMKGGTTDILVTLAEHGLNPDRDHQRLTDDVRAALSGAQAPRQINKLLRIAGDLGLSDLGPFAFQFAGHSSSMVRAAAARAIGKLATVESGEDALLRLREDPVEDVKRAGEAALKELRTPLLAESEAEDEAPDSLNESARAALQQLLAQLQDEGA